MAFDITYPAPVPEPTAVAGGPIQAVNVHDKGGLESLNQSFNSMLGYKVPNLIQDVWQLTGTSTRFFGSGYTKTHYFRVPNPWDLNTASGNLQLDIVVDLRRGLNFTGLWRVDVVVNGGAPSTFDLHGALLSGMMFIGRVPIDDSQALIDLEISLNTYTLVGLDSYVRTICVFPTMDGAGWNALPQTANARYKRDLLPSSDDAWSGNTPLTPRLINEAKKLARDIYNRPHILATSTTDIFLTPFDGSKQKASTSEEDYSTTNASDDHVYYAALPIRVPPSVKQLTYRLRAASANASASIKIDLSTGETASFTPTTAGWHEVTLNWNGTRAGHALLRGRECEIESQIWHSERIS